MATQGELGRRIDAVIQLAQTFGHRFEEAALFNARAALKQLQKGASKITIHSGTKGGRVRHVPITTQNQVNVLRHVAGVQGKGRSIIPDSSNYIQFRNAAYHALYPTPLKGFHGLRHEYAQARYEMLTKVKCPVASNIQHGRAHHAYIAKQLGLSISAARQLDHAARTTIARELGHGRLEITNNYLG